MLGQHTESVEHQVTLKLRVRAAQAIGNPHEVARYTAQLKRTYN